MTSVKNTDVLTDIVIVGAGPAGLSAACALEGSGLKITLIEPQSKNSLADPKIDGREIALSHFSKSFLEEYGIWQKFDSKNIHLLKEAKIATGEEPFALGFERSDDPELPLGFLVSNHVIRKGLYQKASELENVTILTDHKVCSVQSKNDTATVTLDSKEIIECKLLIVADSRFSVTRRMLGIGAKMKDFGRVMLVCRMEHEIPHHSVAMEHFKYGKTCAILPLQEGVSSFVLTVPAAKSYEVTQLDEKGFNIFAEDIMNGSLGKMKLISERFSYPLIGVYSDKFIAQRAALIGDAAVGMHPVTAHGYNLGVKSAVTLSNLIKSAVKNGQDIGSSWLLQKYQLSHKIEAKPIYEGTNAVVNLFTNDNPAAKLLRRAALNISNHFTPFKKHVVSKLTQTK